MPFCPSCRGEYREGISRCPIHDIELVAEPPVDLRSLPAAEIARMFEDQPVVAARRGMLDAVRDASDLLFDNGIPNMIRRDEQRMMGQYAVFELLVRESDRERTLDLFRTHFAEELEREGFGAAPSADVPAGELATCPACGATVPDDQPECPGCGLFIGLPG